MGGAKAVGMGSEIGSLEVSKRADVIIFDVSNSPGMIVAAENDPVAAIVLHASVRDVETVIIDGKIRKSRGKLSALDRVEGGTDGSWKNVVTKLKESAARITKRADEIAEDFSVEQVTKVFGIDEAKLV
jgi:formylmethanofuran dehydrogenase subunit A